MKFTVSEETEIVLDDKVYLLEKGDEIIILESLENKKKMSIARHFKVGEIVSVKEYLDKTEEVKKFLARRISEARNKGSVSSKGERQIEDIKDFINNEADEFILSLINNESVKEEIEEYKRQQAIKIDTYSELDQDRLSIKSEREAGHKKAFGETPKEWSDKNKETKDSERMFESIIGFLSIV